MYKYAHDVTVIAVQSGFSYLNESLYISRNANISAKSGDVHFSPKMWHKAFFNARAEHGPKLT